MSMITATTWVPRGFAAPAPSKYVFDDDEYERISQLAKLKLDDAKEDLEEAQEEKKNGKSSGSAKTQDIEYDMSSFSSFKANLSIEKLTTT
jgi:periodic tryptophan protein 1